ncbi:MAG: MazG family protein [Candidatus Fermentibacteraceae bacterium]
MDEGLSALRELLNVVRTLRGPGGCSWDREQTLESLRPYLLEEAHEVAEAAERSDWNALSDELGDLLLHILMWSEIAKEKGLFSLFDVSEGVREKLVRRHPHVFGDKASPSPEEVEKQWESIKKREKSGTRQGFFSSLPGSMPALQTAWRITQRASDAGLEPLPDQSGIESAVSSFFAGPTEENLGQLLLLLSGYAGSLGIEPELALKRANRIFKMGHGACSSEIDN